MAKCQIAPKTSRGIFQADYFWVLTKLGGRVLPKSFSTFYIFYGPSNQPIYLVMNLVKFAFSDYYQKN